MPDQITIRPAGGTWVVRAGGAVIGESDAALAVDEPGQEPVIYFPRGDLAMAFLDVSETETTSTDRGAMRHLSIVTKSTTLRDAAWTYEDPEPGAEQLRDHIAFYPSDTVAVEEI